ncbi:hypothetical protein H0H93_008855 [Arthromyces matolae]|nr:hypothetical protein H0H93_008855 [Arthromyces matolae]
MSSIFFSVSEDLQQILEHGIMESEPLVETRNAQDVPQTNKRPKGFIGWLKRLKEALSLKKSHRSEAKKVKQVRRSGKGVYTFLYGGRVNTNHFYDFDDHTEP